MTSPRREDDRPVTASGSEEKPPRRAWRSPGAIAALLVIAAAGLAADLATKHIAFERLLSGEDVRARVQRARRLAGEGTDSAELLRRHVRISEPWVGPVRFTLSANPGVAFSMPVPRQAVIAATIAVVALVGVFFASSPARDWLSHVALALIVGGALGNLYDRMYAAIHLPGEAPIRHHVRDFIDMTAWGYPWIFNIADALLVVGVGLLIVHWLRLHIEERRAAAGKAREGGRSG